MRHTILMIGGHLLRGFLTKLNAAFKTIEVQATGAAFPVVLPDIFFR